MSVAVSHPSVPTQNRVLPRQPLRELLGARTLYGGESCKVATYHDGSDISLPARAGQVQLRDVLPDEDRALLDEFEHSLFVPPEEYTDSCGEKEARPFWDPVLQNSQTSYIRLMRRLPERGLLAEDPG